jgi:hypothetical protein
VSEADQQLRDSTALMQDLAANIASMRTVLDSLISQQALLASQLADQNERLKSAESRRTVMEEAVQLASSGQSSEAILALYQRAAQGERQSELQKLLLEIRALQSRAAAVEGFDESSPIAHSARRLMESVTAELTESSEP